MTASSPPRTADPAAIPQRALAPDIARGLMLALIAIANVSWFLWGHEGAVGLTPHVPARGPVDTVVQVVMTITVDHRAMPLFAFLLGYGMVQFYRSRIDRGMEPRIVRLMMRRRHWALLLLGLLHAALLFFGDILGAYAVAALLLVWIFFGRRTRTLIIWAGIISGLLLLYAVFSIVSAVALMFFVPPEVLASMETQAAPYSNAWLRDLAYAQPYLPTVLTRTGMWLIALLPGALMTSPLPILLGWIAARGRLLDEPWRHLRLLRRIAAGGIAIGWLGGLPDALAITGVIPLPDALSWTFGGVNGISGICCGIGYAAAFGLLAVRLEQRPTTADAMTARIGRAERRALRAQRAAAHAALPPAERAYGEPATSPAPAPAAAPQGVARALSAVGQRSLTFYLFQSLLLAPLLASWGLGLAPQLSTASAIGIALAVWLLSLPIAAWMDGRGMRGPAEWLLRRLTYGRHDRRRPTVEPTT